MAARLENEQEQHDNEPWQTVAYSGKRLRATKQGVPPSENAATGELLEHGSEPRIPGRDGPGSDQESRKKKSKLGFGDVNKLVDDLVVELEDTPKNSKRARTIREALSVLGLDLEEDQEEEAGSEGSPLEDRNPVTEEQTEVPSSSQKSSKGGREVKRRRVKATVARMAKVRRSPRKRSRIPKATSESDYGSGDDDKRSDDDEEEDEEEDARDTSGGGNGRGGDELEEGVGGVTQGGESGSEKGSVKEKGAEGEEAGGVDVREAGDGHADLAAVHRLDRERRRLESVLEPGMVATSGDKVARRAAAVKKAEQEEEGNKSRRHGSGDKDGQRGRSEEPLVGGQRSTRKGDTTSTLGKRKKSSRAKKARSVGGSIDGGGQQGGGTQPIVVEDDSVSTASDREEQEETVVPQSVGVAVTQEQIPAQEWVIRESTWGGHKRRPMWFRRTMKIQRRVQNVLWRDLAGLPSEVVLDIIGATAIQFGEAMGLTRTSPKRQRLALLRRAFLLSPMALLPSRGVTWHTKTSLRACSAKSLREMLVDAGFAKDTPEDQVLTTLWRVMGDVAEEEITAELASMGLERPAEPGTLSEDSRGGGNGGFGGKGGACMQDSSVPPGSMKQQQQSRLGQQQQSRQGGDGEQHGTKGGQQEVAAGVVTDAEVECAVQELNLQGTDGDAPEPFWEWWQERRFAMTAPCTTWASWGIDEMAALAMSHGKSEVQATVAASGKQRFVIHVRKDKATRKNLIFFCQTIVFQRQKTAYAGQLPTAMQAAPELERTFRNPVQAVKGHPAKALTPVEKIRRATLTAAQLETVSASVLATIAKVKGIVGGDALHEMITQAECGAIPGELVFEAYDQLLRDIAASDAEQKNRQLTLSEVMAYPLSELRRRAQDRAVPNAATLSTSALRKALMSPPRAAQQTEPSTAPPSSTKLESEEVRRLKAELAAAEEKAKALEATAQRVQQRASEGQPRSVPLTNPAVVGRTVQPTVSPGFTAGSQHERMHVGGGQGPCQYCHAADHAQELCPIATSRDALNRDKKRGAFKTTLLKQPASKTAVPLPECYRRGVLPKPVSDEVWASAKLDPELANVVPIERIRALVDELCSLDDEAIDFRDWTVQEPKVYVKAFWKWAPLSDSEFSMMGRNPSIGRPANPMWVICEAFEPHNPIEWYGRAGEESGIWAWVVPMRNLQGWPGDMRFSQRSKFTEVRDGVVLPIQQEEGDECFEGWIPKPRIGFRGSTPEKVRATIDPAIGILRDLSASVFTNPRVFTKTSYCEVIETIGAALKRFMGLEQVTLYDRGAGVGELQHQLRRMGTELNLVAMEWMPQDPSAQVERIDSFTLGRREVLERGEGFAMENMNFREQARRNKQAESMGLMSVGGITGVDAPTDIAGGKVLMEIPIGYNLFVTEGAQQPISVECKLWLWVRNDVLEASKKSVTRHNQEFWEQYKKKHGLSSKKVEPVQAARVDKEGLDSGEESSVESEDQPEVEGESADEREEAWLRQQMQELEQRRSSRRAGRERS